MRHKESEVQEAKFSSWFLKDKVKVMENDIKELQRSHQVAVSAKEHGDLINEELRSVHFGSTG
jgi:hypothetical protein